MCMLISTKIVELLDTHQWDLFMLKKKILRTVHWNQWQFIRNMNIRRSKLKCVSKHKWLLFWLKDCCPGIQTWRSMIWLMFDSLKVSLDHTSCWHNLRVKAPCNSLITASWHTVLSWLCGVWVLKEYVRGFYFILYILHYNKTWFSVCDKTMIHSVGIITTNGPSY